MEFDPAAALTESSMVRNFEEGLKPSIKAEMDQNATHLNNYKELVAKAVRAEAKASLWSRSYIRETNQQVLWVNRPAHTTAHKVQTQEATKDHCGDESKAKAFESAFTQDSKPSDKAKKGWRRWQNKDKQDSNNPATRVNKAKVGVGKKKDISEVKCYNCNKKRHFARKCLEPQKPIN